MKNDRNGSLKEKAIDSVLHDVQHLVERTERFLRTKSMTVNELQESSVRVAEMRALLNDLSVHSARCAPSIFDGAAWSASGKYLAERCLDLEGRIKEKRNDLLQSGGRSASERETAERAAGPGNTILVVEDDVDVREMTLNVLKEYGYSVLEAANGSQAMAMFVAHQENIKLSLIDIFLPGKNGKELSDEIRRLRPDAKVLFTSGYSAHLLSTQDLNRPDTAFIPKPSSPEELVRKIQGMLTHRMSS